MQLQQLASLLAVSRVVGDGTVDCRGIGADSRRVQPGDLFLCLPGFTVDGHDYAEQAVASGAAALVVERELDVPVPQLVVKDARHAMAVLADYMFDSPSRRMRM
ncbi:Mur ligase domain-containing protein, partial [Paenibacillus polymyxa]